MIIDNGTRNRLRQAFAVADGFSDLTPDKMEPHDYQKHVDMALRILTPVFADKIADDIQDGAAAIDTDLVEGAILENGGPLAVIAYTQLNIARYLRENCGTGETAPVPLSELEWDDGAPHEKETDEPVPHLDQLEYFSASPERIDEYLRDHLSDDRRLAFYQWIGRVAVSEALGDIRAAVREDPTPPKHRYYTQESVYEFLDGPEEGGPYPSVLPLGLPFCDVPHHAHTDGGSRIPSCRLDSPE